MMVKTFTVNMLSTNCYVASCEDTWETVIIDPGFDNQLEAEDIITFINGNDFRLRCIINTHGHPDHTCGNGLLKRMFNVPISIHEADAHMLGKSDGNTSRFLGFNHLSPPADILLQDNDSIKFGNVKLGVIHTPGHTQGSMSLLGEKVIFTGDTVFAGSIGRTDFPKSSVSDIRLSLKKLLGLPDHYALYPGHGPATTLGREKRVNPFLQLP